MELDVDRLPVRVHTGGREHDPRRPAVLLVHGAANDHSVWQLLARDLAASAFAVLAPDLPGHGASAGAPLTTIEALADWVIALLDSAGVARATLVGHSMGSLVTLEAAARAPQRVDRLVLAGCVVPMPVSPALLDAARTDRAAAHAMINRWSFGPATQAEAAANPGRSLIDINLAMMARQAEGVLATDLGACNAYTGGLGAAEAVRCPSLLLIGDCDQMTPLRAAHPLHQALGKSGASTRIMQVPSAGHALMAEAPGIVADSIRGFLTST